MATVLSAVGGPVAATVGVATGLAEGALVLAFVTPRRYRHGDEVDCPPRSRWWVPVWTVFACASLAFSWWHAPAYMAIVLTLVAPLVAACVVDVDVQRLPDAITLPTAAVLVVALGILAAVTSAWSALGRSLGACFLVFLVFFALAFIGGGGGMGMGDVKLSVSIGLMNGYLSWVHVFLAVLAGALIGSFWGLGLRVVKGESAREFAFGPHMVAGAQWCSLCLLCQDCGHDGGRSAFSVQQTSEVDNEGQTQ